MSFVIYTNSVTQTKIQIVSIHISLCIYIYILQALT